MNASSLPVAVDAQVDPTVFLMGRPPMHGSVQWLQQSVEGQQADVSELADHWRAANARIKLMSDDDSLDLSAPDVTPLPPSLASLGQAVLEHPATKQAFGWTRNSMKIGETVTVEGSRAKDGSNVGNARSVILASTGQRLFAASSQTPTP